MANLNMDFTGNNPNCLESGRLFRIYTNPQTLEFDTPVYADSLHIYYASGGLSGQELSLNTDYIIQSTDIDQTAMSDARLTEDGFDKTLITTEKKVKPIIKEELEKIYEEYRYRIQRNKKDNKMTLSKLEKEANRLSILNDCKEKIEQIVNGDFELACNYLVELLYDKPISKQFCWDMCGDYIIKLLLKRNNNKFNIVVKDDNGDIHWNGENYRIDSLEVKNKC